MKSGKSFTDDNDDDAFAVGSPAHASLLADDATAAQPIPAPGAGDAGQGSPAVASAPGEATTADASAPATTAAVVDTAPMAPVAAAAADATDASIGIQSQADTSLIHLDQFRADPRFSGIDGHGVSVV